MIEEGNTYNFSDVSGEDFVPDRDPFDCDVVFVREDPCGDEVSCGGGVLG